MQFVKGLLNNLGSQFMDNDDRNGMDYQLRTNSLSRRDAQMVLPTNNADVHLTMQYDDDDDDDDLMDPPMEELYEDVVEDDPDATRRFIEAYVVYMTNYYGRSVRYRTDLFCAMFPVDIMDPTVDQYATTRYWWFSIRHPVCRVLQEHFSSYNQDMSEGSYNSELYGECIIYCDEVIEFFIDAAVEMCKSIGLELEDVRSAYARKCLEDNCVAVVNSEKDSIIQEAISRPEGAKKAD